MRTAMQIDSLSCLSNLLFISNFLQLYYQTVTIELQPKQSWELNEINFPKLVLVIVFFLIISSKQGNKATKYMVTSNPIFHTEFWSLIIYFWTFLYILIAFIPMFQSLYFMIFIRYMPFPMYGNRNVAIKISTMKIQFWKNRELY